MFRARFRFTCWRIEFGPCFYLLTYLVSLFIFIFLHSSSISIDASNNNRFFMTAASTSYFFFFFPLSDCCHVHPGTEILWLPKLAEFEHGNHHQYSETLNSIVLWSRPVIATSIIQTRQRLTAAEVIECGSWAVGHGAMTDESANESPIPAARSAGGYPAAKRQLPLVRWLIFSAVIHIRRSEYHAIS